MPGPGEIEEAMPNNRIPDHLQMWIDARKRFRLSHAHVQMARELGLNPKKMGKLDNHEQEPWKLPMPLFIALSKRRKIRSERRIAIRWSAAHRRREDFLGRGRAAAVGELAVGRVDLGDGDAGGDREAATGVPVYAWCVWDHLLRGDERLEHVVAYLLNNPLRVGARHAVGRRPVYRVDRVRARGRRREISPAGDKPRPTAEIGLTPMPSRKGARPLARSVSPVDTRDHRRSAVTIASTS